MSITLQSINKITVLLVAAFVLLSPFTAAAWADPQIKDFDQRCVDGRGVVEVELYSVTDATLINDTTGETVDVWEVDDRDDSDKNTVFLTYSDLDDGEYTLHVVNYDYENNPSDDHQASRSFTIDCAPEVCEPNPDEDLELIDFNATDGTATIKNNSELCSYDVGIASYKGFKLANNTTLEINSQELFDDASSRLQPNDEKTLDIDVPNCSYQIDVFYGDLITDFSNGDRYGDRKLAWSHEDLDNICGEEEEIEELELVKQCDPETNAGEISVTAPNGIDSWELYNTSNPSTPVESGSNVAAGGTVTIEGLANGNYRFEATLGEHHYETISFSIDCDTEEPDDLTGQCEVSPRNVETGETVTWSASATGGDGSYTYSWNLEGSDDDADTKSISTSYANEGTFSGTVEISDGDLVIQRTCNVRVEDEDDNGGGGGGQPLDPKDDDDNGRVRGDRDVFSVQCLPEKSAYLVGEVVTFEATVDGDIDEDDADFDWSGDASIDADDERATAQYTTTGIKEVSVRAEYDGDVERDTCFVQIARSGVTLDQVPYTGPGDMAKTIGFIMTLVLLAGAGGYAMIRRREEFSIPVGIPTKSN